MSEAANDLEKMMDDENYDVRVTIKINAKALKVIKALAKKDGVKYQPWLNNYLVNEFLNKDRDKEKLLELLKDKQIMDIIKQNVLNDQSA